MYQVLQHIQRREQVFSELPFFQFLRDTQIDPYVRVSWFPCLAHFAMSFKDLNNDVLRDISSSDPIQQMLNRHTLEDGSHWKWYLRDLESLGFDPQMRFSEFLRFMWSNETLKTRRLSHNLVALCRYQPDPVLRLAVVEAIEATGTPALKAMAAVSEELRSLTHQRYFYISSYHVAVETGHVQSDLDEDETEDFLLSLTFTEAQLQQAIALVDQVFDSFTECMAGLMEFVRQQSFPAFAVASQPEPLPNAMPIQMRR